MARRRNPTPGIKKPPTCPCCCWRTRAQTRDAADNLVYLDFCRECYRAARAAKAGQLPPAINGR